MEEKDCCSCCSASRKSSKKEMTLAELPVGTTATIVKVMPEDNVLLVKGAIPGANGGILLVRSAIKKSGK